MAFPMMLQAQEPIQRSSSVVTISGKQFYLHHVKTGETLEALVKAYSVTEKEILELNPEVRTKGLEKGMVLGIPLREVPATPAVEVPEETPEVVVEKSTNIVSISGKRYYMHVVKSGQTLKSIAKAYGVTEKEITDLNPEIRSKGVERGMVIGILVKEVTSAPVVETPEPEVDTPEPEVVETPEPVTVETPEPPVVVPEEPEIVEIPEEPEIVEPEVIEIPENPQIIEPELVEIPEEPQIVEPEIIEIPEEPQIVEIIEEPQNIEPEPQIVEPEIVQIPEEPQVVEPEIIEIPEEPQIVIPEEPVVVEEPAPEGDEIHEGYIVHTVQQAEKTKALLRRWNVTEEEFRRLNPSVGSRVFVGQKVLIPVHDPSILEAQPETEPETPIVETPIEETPVVVTPSEEPISIENPELDEEPEVIPEVAQEQPTSMLVFSGETPDDCYGSLEHADRLYHVALLVPLYLDEIDRLSTARDKIDKTKKSRSLRFLQFYEGFKMAVDSLTNNYGLRLELTVIDVNENTAGAEAAVDQLRGQHVDLIIGPFFSKSFTIVQEYAASQGIFVVNPLTERESILADAPNVLKLKPNTVSMAEELARLIRVRYPKAKVSMIVDDNAIDSLLSRSIELALETAVAPEVVLSNEELLEQVREMSRRKKMGKRLLSTLEVEGQIFSTKALEEHPEGEAVFENHFRRYTFSDDDVNAFKDDLSTARENVLIAFGNDVVFATKILNNCNKSAQNYPLTLIGLPQWSNFENLLVENLLNMNAVYFDDHFVDYNDTIVLQFVDDFRARYEAEPNDYAFEGFDVGWYFLNALMQFGSRSMDCLPYYHLPLLHTRYYFNKSAVGDGFENRYWNIYQYDNQLIELKPIRIHGEEN